MRVRAVPIAGSLLLHGLVERDAADRAVVLSGWVEDLRATEPTLVGTVDRSRIEAFDADITRSGVRVFLDGADVTDDLVGEVETVENLDSHLKTASFELQGRQYSPYLTTRTWTRTPVRIVWQQGEGEGPVLEHDELVGVVESCNQTGADQVWQIQVADSGLLVQEAEVCFETEPFAGLTRGQIARSCCAAVGHELTDIPEGAVYRKPFQAGSRRLFEILAPWGEPEDWYWRTDPDSTIVAYSARLKTDPEAPDHVWRAADLYEPPEVVPPRKVPSRWIQRATSAVFYDEVGVTTEYNVFEIREVYRPIAAVGQQNSSGEVVPVSVSSAAALRVRRRIVDQVQRRGDKPIRQVTTEKQYFNPSAGKWSTNGGPLGEGPVGDGYYHLSGVYVDEEGQYRAWIIEKFVETGRREQRWLYDTEQNLVSLTQRTSSWFRRTQGVRQASVDELNVVDAVVGGDDRSYRNVGAGRIEEYGLSKVEEASYTYDTERGHLHIEDLSHRTYYGPRATIDPTKGYYVLADGTGQSGLVANWREKWRQVRVHRVDGEGRSRGYDDLLFAWIWTPATEAVLGALDWGDAWAIQEVERFGLSRIESQEIVTLGDSYLEVTYPHDGPRQETRRMGRPPLPRYLTSPWTRLLQEPLEVVYDDPAIEAWFGRSLRVLDHPYVQTVEEAERLILRELRRLLSRQVTVERPETLARVGDTVELLVPSSGIAHRLLIVERRPRRDPRTGAARATYVLEDPLL